MVRQPLNVRADMRNPIPPTKVKLCHDLECLNGLASNISRSGMFVQTATPGNAGETFDLEFTIPSTDIEIKCAASIAWGRASRQYGAHGFDMGLKFSGLDPLVADRVETWVLRQLKN